jgi:hypothetical protein
MFFEIIAPIDDVEVIARSREIRTLRRLRRAYGGTNWRKKKGVTRVRLRNGQIRKAEVHWYEAHGVGRKEFKVKRFLT